MRTTETKPTRTGNSLPGWAMLLAVLTFIAYLHGGFIWDDDAHVTDSQPLRTAHGLGMIWTDPGARNSLGIASALLGKAEEAMGHWKQAARLNPDDAAAQCN